MLTAEFVRRWKYLQSAETTVEVDSDTRWGTGSTHATQLD